jgi:hypothetical protein
MRPSCRLRNDYEFETSLRRNWGLVPDSPSLEKELRLEAIS